MGLDRRKDITGHDSLERLETGISADPNFRPRKRKCVCGKEFMTTPLRRYFCPSCWSKNKRKTAERIYRTRKDAIKSGLE